VTIRIAHVISGLGSGGAENMLERLISGLPAAEFEHTVFSLTGDGPVGVRLRAAGCETRTLGFSKGAGALLACARLARGLRANSPDLVQTWLCHADLLGGLAARYVTRTPVVWGVHQAETDRAMTPLSTRWAKALCARLAGRIPARVVSVSQAGARLLVDAGYPRGRIVVIPNGVDTDRFHPDANVRAALRAELASGPADVLIGLVARWHPDKDHATFVAAAGRVRAACPAARFVLVGNDMTATNTALADLLIRHGVVDVCHLLGHRDDLPRLFAGFDLAVLSSRTEAFPNVILEAMATALPTVATDVGDVAYMIGETGRVVPPGDPAALAEAILAVCAATADQRGALGAIARQRVIEHFGLATSIARYRALYTEVLHPS